MRDTQTNLSHRFNNAEFRPAERQLLIDGQPVALGARAFDLLNLLITQRDRVVGKRELIAAVWPGLIVEENNLQVQISTLRKILGSASISTIAGLGYQFTAPLVSDFDANRPIGLAEPAATPTDSAAAEASSVAGIRHRFALAAASVLIAGIVGLLWNQLGARPHVPPASAAGFPAMPPHSIAVLPFANMSGDPSQDYFSDGLSEELLDSLSKIPDLRVAARVSSFAFRNKGELIADVGRELNVRAVLEGSVRRDGPHVRISAQLVDVATGYDLWSQSYDRDIADILSLQSEIATAVTGALQATLLPEASAAIELGGTSNARAFDAYLRGETLEGRTDKPAVLGRLAAYEEAIRQDPKFAKAYIGEAAALDTYGGSISANPAVHEYYERARTAAETAVALAPELGRAHSVLAQILLFGYLDFAHSLSETERALTLSPGDTFVLRRSVPQLALLGRGESAVLNAQRAVSLDPINSLSYMALGFARYHAHQYPEAIQAFDRATRINPELADARAFRGLSYRKLGQLDAAVNSCRQAPIATYNLVCLAMVYHEQGKIPEAREALMSIRRALGDAAALQYVEIYAQWNDVPAALSWMDTAYRLRDVGLASLMRNELLDPLRSQAQFQSIERTLSFPN